MLIRSFGPGGAFEVADWTEEITTIQNQWGTIGNLGLFENVPVTQYAVSFESTQENGGIIIDRVRGDRHNVAKAQPKQIHTFAVPHFNLDDMILPQDLQGKRAYGSANDTDILSDVRVKKMNYIRKAHARTLEIARAQVITQGTVYAPSGTTNTDWYAEFGVTRTVVSFPFSSASTQVMPNLEKIIAAIQDNAGVSDFTGIVGLCSPQFFSALISHPSIQVAYTYYASTQDLLRTRQAPGGSVTAMNREFDFGGIRFIEMRNAYNGARLIPDNEAYFVPTGTDIFKTYFAPCDRMDFVNTLGQELYLFEQPALDGTGIALISESNHASAVRRPELVIKATMS